MRLLVTLVVAGALATGCGKKDKDTGGGGGSAAKPATGAIVIGHFASMTGPQATFGISTDRAIRLAIKERNAKGGVKGRQVELVTIDDAGKQSEAATAVTRLINDHGAVAILGEVASSLSLAGGPIAQKAKIPMITPSSTNPDVTDVGDYVFRVCFLDDFQGWVGAKFAKENLKATKAAIIYDQGQAYSSGLADYFEKAFKEMGGQIVTRQAYTGGNLEISSQLQAVKGSGAEVVYLPGYYSDAGTIIRKARDAGIKAPFVGGDGWDSEELPKIAGDAINGNYFSNHYAPEEDRPEVKNFVEKYKAEYQSTADGLAALGYDAALVLFDAMERAPSLSGKDLRDAIAATKNFTGVTGTFSIDENRNAMKSAVIVEYKDGKQTMAARVAQDAAAEKK
ncbi:MAG: ABC transporter substrate-binding protein [Deltaproteobacteria bacterium]|nr:ABC transporter substrate-binding protein [Deltaproteobacteria bacterium]MDQ3298395.1 ABC transporter substrate-binding protein [Myxococcota bacterium]